MPGTTTGGVRLILRLEGLGVFLMALGCNAKWGMGWKWFALFFFVPDLSMLGYLAGAKVGAAAYNAAHAYLGAILCVALGVLLRVSVVQSAGMLWIAHIGLDRACGYGLKYFEGFGFTHLGLVGRQRSA